MAQKGEDSGPSGLMSQRRGSAEIGHSSNSKQPAWFDPQQPFALTIEATLPVSVGGNSEKEHRWREDGREPQVEASSKRQEADPVRFWRKCRAAASQQSRLRSRRSRR